MQILDNWEEEEMPLDKKQAVVQKGILWIINVFSGLVNPITWCFILGELDWFMIGVYVFLYNSSGILVLYVICILLRAFLRFVEVLLVKFGLKSFAFPFFWLRKRMGFLGFAAFFNVVLLGEALYYMFKWV